MARQAQRANIDQKHDPPPLHCLQRFHSLFGGTNQDLDTDFSARARAPRVRINTAAAWPTPDSALSLCMFKRDYRSNLDSPKCLHPPRNCTRRKQSRARNPSSTCRLFTKTDGERRVNITVIRCVSITATVPNIELSGRSTRTRVTCDTHPYTRYHCTCVPRGCASRTTCSLCSF